MHAWHGCWVQCQCASRLTPVEQGLKEEQVEEMKTAIQSAFEGVAKDGFEAEVRTKSQIPACLS